MACFHPLKGYYYTDVTGKKVIKFNLGLIQRFLHAWLPIDLPCGRCIGCRLERSKQWAIRCVHESQLYSKNCFITLTFDDAHLDEDGSLRVRDFQLFMKKLRKKFPKIQIRFFHCGEYGELNKRPHHHAIIFNFDFDDKYLWKRGANPLWRSPTLEKLWPYGMSSIGKVTFESAAYVARYVMKKVNGEFADEHYANEFGVVCKSEFVTMSRRPGIAHDWFAKFGKDLGVDSDFVVMRGGIKLKPPRYYDNLFDLTNPEEFIKVKKARRERAAERSFDNTPERLKVREEITNARLGQLKRKI